MFESLTRFLPTLEHVQELEDAIYAFQEDHPDFELNHYYDILERNGLKWDMSSMTEADPAVLDGQAVMALLIGAVRAEHFCGGAFFDFCESGSMERWLARLKEIDETASLEKKRSSLL